ncbi:MAG: hypothetical protein KGJ09_02090 [Candidatus Omnitrophica bacterium]|nr:hypothetical protein [Candidatus Omnitrophota bacterium]MDE2008848.1 hypothetical protein [Candidatus Omnitrophota bacterium]MDE2213589.1 hypothetical protein [Candidatus Omnitrophota bacterium]MDE2230510.1 hypothetical protein [Candidatus Omnitrophota bacterium]
MLRGVKAFIIVMFFVIFVSGGSNPLRADDSNLDAATQARIAKADQGPRTIDVSGYPQKLQDIYTDIFSQKCTQCHRLSRPINSDFALPSEWESYVKKMMHKPGSNINFGQARKIIDFLIYDSSVRKKALLEEKLSKLTPEQRAAQEAKIKKVQDKYGQ